MFKKFFSKVNKNQKQNTLLNQVQDTNNELATYLLNMDDKANNSNKEKNAKGTAFEMFLETLFQLSGYKVKRTNNLNDYGIDLFIEKDNNYFAIQAKAFSIDSTFPVERKYINQFSSVLNEHNSKITDPSKTYKGVFITTNYFYLNAKNTARELNIELIDRVDLIHLIAQLHPSLLANEHLAKLKEKMGKCPKCDSILILTKGKFGKFIGCHNHPECNYTKPYK